MKKITYLVLAFIVVFSLAGCRPKQADDITSPVIALTGLETTFDEGDLEPQWLTYFTVTDDIDGTIQCTNSMVNDDVDMSTPGTYTVTLTVSDKAGNESTESITITIEEVIVIPQGDLIATYEGVAPVGMGDSGTNVTVLFFDDNTFELSTASPRGTGTYAIDSGVITFTYEEAHPDGGDWVLNGTINTTDVTDVTTVFTIDPVEYAINMGSGPSVMDVGNTTFNIILGSKAVVVKNDGVLTSFDVDATEPDWTTYFTITDETDGTIAVTEAMITENVDMAVDGMYTVTLEVVNSSGNSTSITIMIFVNAPEILFTYQDVSASSDPMMAGAVIALELYDNDTFMIYSNEVLKGNGTYTLVGSDITFTFTDPELDYEGNAVPTIVGTIDTDGLAINTIITTTATEIYLPMGPTYGAIVDYGPMNLDREELYTYTDVSASTDPMMAGAVISINVYDDDTFKIYNNDVLKGQGTYALVDQEITFTFTDPELDYEGNAVPTIVGTIDTNVLTEATVITTTATEIYLPMGPTYGAVVDYGPMNLDREALYSYSDISASTDPMMAGANIMIDVFEDDTFKIYNNGVLKGQGTYALVDLEITFTFTDPELDYEGNAVPTIVGTIDTVGLAPNTVITTTATQIYLPMGPTYGAVVDYGPMNLDREALYSYSDISASTDPMMAGANIMIDVFEDDTFKIYNNGVLKGQGTYALVDLEITFTFTDPELDYEGNAVPTIVGTIDTVGLAPNTVITTTATQIYLPMGPTYGAVVDYGPMNLDREALYSYTDTTDSTDSMLVGAVLVIEVFEDDTFKIYTNDSLKGEGTFEIVTTQITFTFTDPELDYEGNAVPTIVGTIDTDVLTEATIITTTATQIYLPMGPTYGAVVDYEAMEFTVPTT